MIGRPRPFRLAVGIFAGIALLMAAPAALAHDFTIMQVVAVFTQDGKYQIDMRLDLDALALGVSPAIPSEAIAAELRKLSPEELALAEDDLRETLLRRVRVRFDDDKKVTPEVGFPDHHATTSSAPAEPSVFGTTARLTGFVPADAVTFTFGASRAFNAVQITILDEATAGGAKYMLTPGSDSPTYRLHEVQREEHAVVVWRYVVLGFEHILPKGLDHILFVVGLFLLSSRMRPLLWQITAFTVAHSVSLALSMAHVASLPSSVVEPLIALSIAYVAAENLFVRDMKPWRPALVFMFGLLHGMGFAGVLRELGMPDGRFATALIGFNVGVELGQVTVVAIAFLLVGWFRRRSWYRAVIVRPASLGIALVGLYWAVQRVGLLG